MYLEEQKKAVILRRRTMAIKEVYLVGDKQRLVVKNFISDLEIMDFDVKVIEPGLYNIDRLPRESVHVIVCLSSEMEFGILKSLADKVLKYDMHLYLAGSMPGLTPTEESFMRQIPGFQFSSLPVDFEKLLGAFDYNERKRKRILVIDDEPIMLRSIKNWLDNDFEVSIVNTGHAALSFLDKHPTDLILLDYEMPFMNGPEVLMKLRTNPITERLPVIFLTAKNDKDSVMTVMKLKPEGYILKNKPADDIKKAVIDFFKKQTFLNY